MIIIKKTCFIVISQTSTFSDYCLRLGARKCSQKVNNYDIKVCFKYV